MLACDSSAPRDPDLVTAELRELDGNNEGRGVLCNCISLLLVAYVRL